MLLYLCASSIDIFQSNFVYFSRNLALKEYFNRHPVIIGSDGNLIIASDNILAVVHLTSPDRLG